jgi:hypothetical protein
MKRPLIFPDPVPSTPLRRVGQLVLYGLALPFVVCFLVLAGAVVVLISSAALLLRLVEMLILSPIARHDPRWNRETSTEWVLARLRGLDATIHGAPGWRLYRVANWVYSRRTFDEVFVPVLSDMQVEYFDALANGQRGKAAWVRVRGYWRFASHVVAQAPVSFVRVVSRWWFSAP